MIDKVFIIALVLAVVIVGAFILLNPKILFDGSAAAPPVHILPISGPSHHCGDGTCDSGEDYYNCPADCCAEENYQANEPSHCCSGLTAVVDVCERAPVVIPPGESPPATTPIQPPTGTSAAVKTTGYAAQQPISTGECYFCVNCGNGKCGKHENAGNCPQDCAVCGNGICEPPAENFSTCPQDCCVQAGNIGIAPIKCCEGLTKINPCEIEPLPSECARNVQLEACIKCGDGKCGDLETPSNCPEDCLQNVTRCEQLGPLNASINATFVTRDRQDKKLKFYWTLNNVTKNSTVSLEKIQLCEGRTVCRVLEKTIVAEAGRGSENREYEKNATEDLEFYRLVAEIRIGPKEAKCKPVCMPSCGAPDVTGWCDPCTETLLKSSTCGQSPEVTGAAAQQPVQVGAPSQPPSINPPQEGPPWCCFVKTKSEGWYDASCDKASSSNLIEFASGCLNPAMMCNQSSETFVRFAQNFIRPTDETKTGINWFVNYWPTNTEDMLVGENGLWDYIARWEAQGQKQVGSALGNPVKICIPNGPCQIELVVTGPFDLDIGMPYFASLVIRTPDKAKTYAGKIPEHVTFNLVGNPNGADNYIVLPVDTRIKNASQLCQTLSLSGQETIRDWNAESQSYGNYKVCGNRGDFDLQPGTVYYVVGLTNNISWTQE